MKQPLFVLKPIPKYITEKIKKLDLERCPTQKGRCRFYSYLIKRNGELTKITVAVLTRYNKWCIKQVAVHGVKSDKCFVRDIVWKPIGGYNVGFYTEGLSKYQEWYEDGYWYDADFKNFNPTGTPVNLDFINKFPEYKYSAWQFLRYYCPIDYLKIYTMYPQTEYLMKLGLGWLHNKITVLKLIGKDKQFCKWLIKQKDEIAKDYNYAGVLIDAYKTGKSIKQIQKFATRKKEFEHEWGMQPVRDLFRSNLEKFFNYIDTQKISASSYNDYLTACTYLGLDMSLPKNRIPHDFKRWHNIRIEQYRIKKAEDEAKQNEELRKQREAEHAKLCQQFAAVAEKYLTLQNRKPGAYAVIIPRSPKDLEIEGEKLLHCVGTHGYDKKMAREETLIFFVRPIDQMDIPFVTIEYSLKTKTVLQCYGYDNERPDDNVITFVNNVWLPHANKTIKKLCA